MFCSSEALALGTHRPRRGLQSPACLAGDFDGAMPMFINSAMVCLARCRHVKAPVARLRSLDVDPAVSGRDSPTIILSVSLRRNFGRSCEGHPALTSLHWLTPAGEFPRILGSGNVSLSSFRMPRRYSLPSCRSWGRSPTMPYGFCMASRTLLLSRLITQLVNARLAARRLRSRPPLANNVGTCSLK